MVTGKQFYFPMDDRDSFIFLVIVGMRCMWSSTHLVTQLSSCRFTWSSLVPASIESLALSLQCMVQRARRSWNLSSSLVTRAWAWARGAWQRSMHWCTCCIDAWVSSQQLALHRNMRPWGAKTEPGETGKTLRTALEGQGLGGHASLPVLFYFSRRIIRTS